MKLSCLPVSLFKIITSGYMTIGEWAQIARKVGLDGIDISKLFIKSHEQAYLMDFHASVKAEGMPIVMMTVYSDFTHPEAAERDRQAAELCSDIEAAAVLGVKYIRITAGQGYPQTSVDEGIGWVADAFHMADEQARQYGIELVFENHSRPGIWAYPDFAFPPEIFLKILERTKDTSIGVNFDTANVIAYGGDTLALLEKVMGRLKTVHANDTLTSGKLTSTLLGTGLTPFKEIFKVIKKNGFKGWVCIEEASNLGMEGIGKAVAFVRQTWESA
jgi:sugar phosphate isomerase/epimerase